MRLVTVFVAAMLALPAAAETILTFEGDNQGFALNTEDILEVDVQAAPSGARVVFRLEDSSAQKLAELSKALLMRKMDVIACNQVVVSAYVRHIITDGIVVVSNLQSEQDAQAIADILSGNSACDTMPKLS